MFALVVFMTTVLAVALVAVWVRFESGNRRRLSLRKLPYSGF